MSFPSMSTASMQIPCDPAPGTSPSLTLSALVSLAVESGQCTVFGIMDILDQIIPGRWGVGVVC